MKLSELEALLAVSAPPCAGHNKNIFNASP